MNIQFAVRDGEVFIIEVNPRASRTVPFVSKATGVPWAKLAAKVMAGLSLDELGVEEAPIPAHTSVKESVFPFTKFPGVDVILGPEMRSTGEVMGVDTNFPVAFGKSQMASGMVLPTGGTVFLSVREEDKPGVVELAKKLIAAGFEITSTSGTASVLKAANIAVRRIHKLAEGRPNVADMLQNRELDFLINTPTTRGPQTDEGKIRAMATIKQVPLITTLTAASAAVDAIAVLTGTEEDPHGTWTVTPLQDYFPEK